MLVHHAATLFVVIAAWRLGFVRVGALVVLLFDATDVPIDGIRLGQLMQARVASGTRSSEGAAGLRSRAM